MDSFCVYNTPCGSLRLCERQGKLHSCLWVQAPASAPATPLLQQACAWLDAYFAGSPMAKLPPLDLPDGGSFAARALRALAALPYGARTSYTALAALAGSPSAARAAGTVCARNRLQIFVPCHRVLPASGGCGNYAGGRAAKEWLLRHESPATAQAVL